VGAARWDLRAGRKGRATGAQLPKRAGWRDLEPFEIIGSEQNMSPVGLPTQEEIDMKINLVKFFLLRLKLVDTGCEDWYIDVFRCLLTEAMKSHEELKSGLQDKRIGRLAWAARNFLELRVWVQYVAASKENAKRLYDDRMLDASDLMKRIDKLAKPDLVDSMFPVYRDNRTKVAQGLKEADLGDNDHYLRTSDLAVALGNSEFSAMNSILSKLVHPTAFSLFGRATEDSVYHWLFGIGAWCCNDMLIRLDTHMKTLGLPSYLPIPSAGSKPQLSGAVLPE
jgi:hypothetical protein